jgi:hypothetical protein
MDFLLGVAVLARPVQLALPVGVLQALRAWRRRNAETKRAALSRRATADLVRRTPIERHAMPACPRL